MNINKNARKCNTGKVTNFTPERLGKVVLWNPKSEGGVKRCQIRVPRA